MGVYEYLREFSASEDIENTSSTFNCVNFKGFEFTRRIYSGKETFSVRLCGVFILRCDINSWAICYGDNDNDNNNNNNVLIRREEYINHLVYVLNFILEYRDSKLAESCKKENAFISKVIKEYEC